MLSNYKIVKWHEIHKNQKCYPKTMQVSLSPSPRSLSASLSPLSSELPDRREEVDESESVSESESDAPSPPPSPARLLPPPLLCRGPLPRLFFQPQPACPRPLPSGCPRGAARESDWHRASDPSRRDSSSSPPSSFMETGMPGVDEAVAAAAAACWLTMYSVRDCWKVNSGSRKMECSVRLTPCRAAPSMSSRSCRGELHHTGSSELGMASCRRSSSEGCVSTRSRRRRSRLMRYRVREARSSVMGARDWDRSDVSVAVGRIKIEADEVTLKML